MTNLTKEKALITEKVNLMINDGLLVNIPVDNHVTKLEEKINQFSKKSYREKEKKTIEFMKALNNFNRLRILQLLKSGAKCSCELEYTLRLSQPTVSHHVNILEKANVVQIIAKGKWRLIELIESPIIFLVLDQLK